MGKGDKGDFGLCCPESFECEHTYIHFVISYESIANYVKISGNWGRVAQLVRVFDSHSRGRRFESFRDHMSKSKIAFFAIWILIVVIAPVTVFKATPYATVVSNKILVINFWQRIAALSAFVLLFVQIVLGVYMQKLAEKFGGWIFKFHIYEGIAIYSLVVLHTFFFVFYRFKALGVFDPFYVFTDYCLLCSSKIEFFYTFGRIAFVFLTIAVLAAVFRMSNSWMRTNWRKLHILNYFVFFFVAVHLKFVGTDAVAKPFVYFFWPAVLIILAISISTLRKCTLVGHLS